MIRDQLQVLYRQLFWKTSDWLNYAEDLRRTGELSSAIAPYNQVIRREPENYSAWCGKGYVLLDLQSLEEALDCFNKALEIQPDKEKLWYDKARLLVALKRPDEAIASYDEALKITPDSYSILVNKGDLLSEQQQYQAAIDCFIQALKLKPNDPEVLNYLQSIAETLWKQADGLFEAGDRTGAISSYAQAIALKPALTTQLTELLPEKQDYILQQLPIHWAKDGNAGQLYHLLTNLDFMAAKLSRLDLQFLIEDYNLPSSHNIVISERQADCLKLIQGALQLSAYTLTQDKTQLIAQLLGRLLYFEEVIQGLFAQATQKKTPILYPLTATLTPPERGLLKILVGHTEDVLATAVTPDGKKIVSGSKDNTIKIWDLRTGLELVSLTGHKSWVNAVTVTPNGKQIVSGSSDNSIKIC